MLRRVLDVMTAVRPLCVLQVVPELSTGGVERTTIEVAEGIVQAGGRALVASEGGQLEDRLTAVGGEFFRLPLATKNILTAWRNAGRLAAIARVEGVTIIHARSRAPAWSARIAARRLGLPFVTTFHGAYNESNALKKLYNSVMASGDLVIANSGFTADLVKTRYGTDPARVVTIPRGVDFDIFQRGPDAAKGRAPHPAIDPDGGVAFLLPARLTRWKGQELAIEACRLLLERGVRTFQLVIAGSDQGRSDYTAGLLARISAGGLEHHVKLVGDVRDIAAAYAGVDYVLVPSLEPEAFGRTAVEAQAMGRPVIASNIGAPVETVINGETGWQFEAGNAEALADAMATAIGTDAATYARMLDSAWRHVSQLYRASTMVASTLAVYARLLA